MEFEKFPKIPRISKRHITITEKIDGTNGQIYIQKITENGIVVQGRVDISNVLHIFYKDGEEYVLRAGSRKRYINPDEDNFGFAKWVDENAEELSKLGEGHHYGEWYGQGIQRGYGLDHKRFALFNSLRWGEHNPNTPECCGVVPIIGSDLEADEAMEYLRDEGSLVAPGYINPEGIIIYDATTKSYYKDTFENSEGKWKKK